ncbi:MAG: YbaK/EbsC family protein [Bdellovibrio sp.]|nr:YbaK/EbsC family protein [Bdellovibrio sp.]
MLLPGGVRGFGNREGRAPALLAPAFAGLRHPWRESPLYSQTHAHHPEKALFFSFPFSSFFLSLFLFLFLFLFFSFFSISFFFYFFFSFFGGLVSGSDSLVDRGSLQRVKDALALKGVDFAVVELPSSTRTAVDAARSIGCEVAQIVKSLVFCSLTSRKPVLVLACGINRVNEALVAEYVGEPIFKPDAAFVRSATGFAIGGVSPVGHIQPIFTLIDEDLLKYPRIWAAAGTPNSVFGLDSAGLLALTGGRVVKIT